VSQSQLEAPGEVVDGRANLGYVCFITTHGQRLLELRIRVNLTYVCEPAWVHMMLCRTVQSCDSHGLCELVTTNTVCGVIETVECERVCGSQPRLRLFPTHEVHDAYAVILTSLVLLE